MPIQTYHVYKCMGLIFKLDGDLNDDPYLNQVSSLNQNKVTLVFILLSKLRKFITLICCSSSLSIKFFKCYPEVMTDKFTNTFIHTLNLKINVLLIHSLTKKITLKCIHTHVLHIYWSKQIQAYVTLTKKQEHIVSTF
jgi:hypothetical protein